MTRRCSVMRMPLAAHRASMSFDLVAVTPSSIGPHHSTDGLTSPVAVQALPRCDLVAPDSKPRGGRHLGIRREHRAFAPACYPHRLPETPCACRYRPSGADADRAGGAKAHAHGARERLRPRGFRLHRRPWVTG